MTRYTRTQIQQHLQYALANNRDLESQADQLINAFNLEVQPDQTAREGFQHIGLQDDGHHAMYARGGWTGYPANLNFWVAKDGTLTIDKPHYDPSWRR